MAETFLRSIASYIAANFAEEADNVCVVFSNRRARLFYQRELNQIHPVTQWLPEVLSMEDFVQKLTEVNFCDPLAMLFEFYEVYKETEQDQAEPFEQFSTWAMQLLHDFEETDLYMVEADKLYQHVDQAYALKNWSPDGVTLTKNQEQYLRFWSRMGIWYKILKERLKAKGIISQAMAFRMLAEQIEDTASEIPWKHIVFAGFNALNQAEQRFIRILEKRKLATLIWDSDRYYLDNELNEAGYFMRQYMRNYGLHQIQHTENYMSGMAKHIRVTGVAKNTGQAVFAGGILKTLHEIDPGLSNTALVLCDEQLLMPVLEHLPEEISRVNVTMGYPINLLPETGIFQLVFELQAHARKSGKNTSWYFKDLIRLLQHPLMNRLLAPSYLVNCQRQIQQGRHVFINLDKLLKISNASVQQKEVLSRILCPWNDDPGEALLRLRDLVNTLQHELVADEAPKSNVLQQESLFCVASLLNRLQTYKDDFSGLTTVKTLHRLFEQLIRQTSLPFYGEPLDGLQIMGLLETRNLDFKNVILLSVNEGVLPKGRTQNSFIPFDISAAYGLPTYRERDAVFAYHFYRLLQRAENIWLVYNTEPDEFAKGEKSRFIAQIEEEMNFPGIQIHRETWVPDIRIPDEPIIRIFKTPELLQRIVVRFGNESKGILSPSAINHYLECSLRFYFKYLSGLTVEDEFDEDIGADILGTIVHKVLQDFFEPYVGQKILPEYYLKMKEMLPEKIKEVFLTHTDEDDLMQGKNLLTFRGAEQMVSNYLDAERQILEAEGAELILLDVEKKLQAAVQVKGSAVELMLGGFADRIDLYNGVIRIIDYKTGSVDAKQLKIESLDDILNNDKMGKALQLLLYSHLAHKIYPSKQILAGIIALVTPSLGLMEFKHELSETEDSEEFFQSIATELFDPAIPFAKTEDVAKCEYCDFKAICNRQ